MAGKGILKLLVSKVLDGVEFVVGTVRALICGEDVCEPDSPDADSADIPDKKIVCGDDPHCAERGQQWQKFYREVFGLEVDFSKVLIPAPVEDNWLVFVPKKLNRGWIMEAFGWYFDGNIVVEEEVGDIKDPAKVQSYGRADEDYAVSIPDEYLTDLNDSENLVITLEERLLLEMFHRWETNAVLLPDGATTTCDATLKDFMAVLVISDGEDLTIGLEAPVAD